MKRSRSKMEEKDDDLSSESDKEVDTKPKNSAAPKKQKHDDDSGDDNVGNGGRKSCILGITCKIMTDSHRTEKSHPGDDDFVVVRLVKANAHAPPCSYGKQCYRNGYQHCKDYKH